MPNRFEIPEIDPETQIAKDQDPKDWFMVEAFKDRTDFDMPNDMRKMAYGGFEVVIKGEVLALDKYCKM